MTFILMVKCHAHGVAIMPVLMEPRTLPRVPSHGPTCGFPNDPDQLLE
jgi:hypothetical protein